jgi:hypothetical protein
MATPLIFRWDNDDDDDVDDDLSMFVSSEDGDMGFEVLEVLSENMVFISSRRTYP